MKIAKGENQNDMSNSLNTEELIALNAIIDNAPIYGLALLDADIPESERIEYVMNSLKKKEIIVEHSLTDKGLILTRLLDDYKKCKSYVFINRLCIGLLDNEYIVVIEKKANEEYCISRCLKVTLIKKFVLSSTFLRKAVKQNFIHSVKEKMNPKTLNMELDDPKWTEVILIHKYVRNRMHINRLYYMSENTAYQYDYVNQTNAQMSPRDIRMDLMELFEMGGIGRA